MRIFGTILILLVAHRVFPQNSIEFKTLPSVFDLAMEVSGITMANEEIYLPSEKCNKLFRLNKDLKISEEPINLDDFETVKKMINRKGHLEIEGITLYKEHLLMVDEWNETIYSYNLKLKEFKEVIIPTEDKKYLERKDRSGIEGIAVNSRKNVLYLLREKGKEASTGELLSFKIVDQNGSIKLTYLGITKTERQEKWRYTDVCFDAKNNRLLTLKSKFYKKYSPKNKYEVNVVDLDEISGFPAEWYSTNITPNLSKEISENWSTYYPNLEGLHFDGDYLYIVSDNCWGSIKQHNCKKCHEDKRKTAFIQIELSHPHDELISFAGNLIHQSSNTSSSSAAYSVDKLLDYRIPISSFLDYKNWSGAADSIGNRDLLELYIAMTIIEFTQLDQDEMDLKEEYLKRIGDFCDQYQKLGNTIEYQRLKTILTSF